MAENLTQVNSYQDKLLEAMSIVSSQLISSIPYDKTITCTIIDDKDKDKGKYKVTNGDATFDAYSSDTKLKVDDVVYVTIPEGNYDNQKIIQGKKTSDNEKPFVFITPSDTFLDITDNLVERTTPETGDIITKPIYNKTVLPIGLVANEIQGNQKVIKKNIFTASNLETEKFLGYTRLLLKANFSSWIPEAISGNYGLQITVTDNLNTTTNDDHTVDNIAQTKVMLFDCSEMYGNPYNFESFYEQQVVFDISDLNTITDISVDFYQIGESFYDVNKKLLPFGENTENNEFSIFPNNLFVDNLYIGLGYDVSEITDEYIVSVINDSITYSEYRESELNKKEIDLRWVHQFEDGPLVVNPERDFDLNKETARLKDCEIRWYRYKLGAAAADEYSGVYWTGLTITKDEDKYLLSDWDGKLKEINDTNPDGTDKVDENGNNIMKQVPDYGETQALENVIFSPDISYQTEQIKAIIYLDGIAIRGPVITFRNEQSKTGEDVSNFLNALEIECVDNTLGNYLIYNEAGNILNTADSQLERKLKCNFAETGAIAKSELLLDYEKGDTISWKVPIKNSMVSIQRCGKSNTDKYEAVSLTAETYVSNTYFIKDANNKYVVSVGGFKDTETYYKHSLISENIQLNKVWTQVEEYKGPIKAWRDFMKLVSIKKIDNTIECYGYQKIEYLKKSLTLDQYEKNKYYVQNTETGGYQISIEDFKQGIDYYERKEIYDNEGKPILYYKHNEASNGFETYYEPWNIYKDVNQNYLILQNERTLHYNEDTKITSILYPTYKISATYSMYNMNNTVACTIRKDRMIYTTEKEFTFGVSGTMGSDKSLVVDFVGGQTAIIANDTTTAYQLEVKMYDENNKPEDISAVPVTWSWYAPGEDTISSKLKFKTNNTAVVELENSGLDIDDDEQIYIAKVVVGEEGAELETYFPIPIKSSEEYSHIEGATSVIYLSNGEPDYYKGDYKLYETIDDTIGSPIVEVTKKTVTWEVISQENDIHEDKDGNEYRRFVADINKTTVKGVTTYKGLKPVSVYTEGIKNYAVVAKVNGEVVWQQPILVIRNQYPSRVINKWDGKTLTMDEETGTILSTAIAAGKKDENTFTGVMIGDWTGSTSDKSLTQATGVFGFHQGAMSYAFMDNGKAFIGKDGKGRISFNGNNGSISGGYDSSGKNPNMTINLSNGQIDAETFCLKAGAGDKKIILQTAQNGELTNTTTGSKPLQIGKYFDVTWAGHVTAASGKIGAWNFLPTVSTVQGTTASAGSLYSGATPPNQWSSIILDPVKNEITGGKFRASILEATTGTMKLGGYIKVYDHTKTKIIDGNSEVDYTSDGTGGGFLGFMVADFGGETESAEIDSATGLPITVKKAGIGMRYSGGGTVKATSENAGMSYSNFYISLQSRKGVLRGSTARLVLEETAEDPHAGLGYGNTYLNLTSSRGYLRGISGLEFSSSAEGTTSAWMVLGSGSNAETESNACTRVDSTGRFLANKKMTVRNSATGTPLTDTVLTVEQSAEIKGNLKTAGKLGLGGALISEASSTLSVKGSAYVTDYISTGTGYMKLGATDNRKEAYVSTLSVNNGLTVSGGTIDFTAISSTNQKGIRAQFA